MYGDEHACRSAYCAERQEAKLRRAINDNYIITRSTSASV